MKKLPKYDILLNYSDVMDPIKRALKIAIKQGGSIYETGIKYKGYDLAIEELATVLSPDEALSAEILKYTKEDQGRDVYDAILNITFCLGIEQGRRMLRRNLDILRDLLDMSKRHLEAIIKQ